MGTRTWTGYTMPVEKRPHVWPFWKFQVGFLVCQQHKPCLDSQYFFHHKSMGQQRPKTVETTLESKLSRGIYNKFETIQHFTQMKCFSRWFLRFFRFVLVFPLHENAMKRKRQGMSKTSNRVENNHLEPQTYHWLQMFKDCWTTLTWPNRSNDYTCQWLSINPGLKGIWNCKTVNFKHRTLELQFQGL